MNTTDNIAKPMSLKQAADVLEDAVSTGHSFRTTFFAAILRAIPVLRLKSEKPTTAWLEQVGFENHQDMVWTLKLPARYPGDVSWTIQHEPRFADSERDLSWQVRQGQQRVNFVSVTCVDDVLALIRLYSGPKFLAKQILDSLSETMRAGLTGTIGKPADGETGTDRSDPDVPGVAGRTG